MKDAIIIVSGLPRSGTSVMMQMLEAGGIPILTDHIRTPDIDNPKGYYEYENVKRIRTDSSWLADACGKVFKMVSMLLLDLPAEHHYKIVFMQRDLAEVLRSEKKMLDRRGKSRGSSDEEMTELFTKHLSHVEGWLEKQENIDVIYVRYNDLLKDSLPLLEKIALFLGVDLNIEAMAAVIDPLLYRNRISSETR